MSTNYVRPFEFVLDYTPHALSSVLVQFGATKVITAVSVSAELPPWLRSKKGQTGWLTAEYNLLPSSTHSRHRRERNGAGGRTQEIQRLISRSLRGALDLAKMPDITLTVDCDVISADGGTRTASINGAMCALILAVSRLLKQKQISVNPIKEHIAAISVALMEDEKLCIDPDYASDSTASADINVVLTASQRLIEIQGCAEKQSFSIDTLYSVVAAASDALQPVFSRLEQIQKDGESMMM